MKKQRGITLVGAIFILVIVALLGQYLVSITSIQRQTGLMALQSTRAYQAANAGIEWGIDRVVNGGSCAASSNLSPNINSFTVNVNCSQVGSYTEADNTVLIYRINATSEYGSYGDPDYASRRLETIIHN